MNALLSIPYAAWGPVLFVFARVVALFATAPILGSGVLPASVRVLLGMTVAWYALASGIPVLLPPAALWPAALLAQVLVGVVIGALANLVFLLFPTAGGILDMEIGFTVARVFNPFAPAGFNTLLANWFDTLGTVIFLFLGGAQLLVAAATQSFRVVPLDVVQVGLGGKGLAGILDAFYGSFLLAVEVAAPMVLALLLVDLVGAALGRMLPQLNILAFNIPLKMWLGLLLLLLALPGLTEAGRAGLDLLGRDVAAAVAGLAPVGR